MSVCVYAWNIDIEFKCQQMYGILRTVNERYKKSRYIVKDKNEYNVVNFHAVQREWCLRLFLNEMKTHPCVSNIS